MPGPLGLPVRRLLAAAALAAAVAPAGGCEPSPAAAPADEPALAAARITPERVGGHVAYLAGDALRGRLTPSPGLAAAAEYIAGVMRAAGLAPGGEAGGFLQPYPWTGVPSASWPGNVVGLLRGSDSARRGEWVVVSAHFDHVGVGKPDATGDSIYNGADDNASGTAALLELARAFASLPRPPARSLAFVAVSGEEEGLVGSAWFVMHRPSAMTLVADVNLDMIGRNAPDLLYLIGDSLTTLGAAAAGQATRHPELGLRPLSRNDAYRGSDQFPFICARVPALFLHAGLHADYHRPSDEAELLDTDKTSRIARLAFYLAFDVASAPGRPAWTPAGEAVLQQVLGSGACSPPPG